MKRVGVVWGVVTVLAAALAVTAGAALAQSESSKPSTTEEKVYFLWYHPCVGEDILFEGDESDRLPQFTGTGLETGDKYHFVNPGRNTLRETASGLLISNEGATQLLISNGGSPNVLLHYFIMGRTDPVDGQPSFSIERFTYRCIPNGEPQWPEE